MNFKKLITTICIVCVLATLLCIPAFATVSESDGDGYALYNGVKLPDIDSVWDNSTYPYAIIVRSTQADAFILSFSTEIWERIDVAGSSYKSTFTYGTVVSYVVGGTFVSWELSNVVMDDFDEEYFTAFWVNNSLYDISDEAVYLAASTPIPLDGYNVIEWDGDTTGLSPIGDGIPFYVIAEYSMASDALAVLNENGLFSVYKQFSVDGTTWRVDVAPSSDPIAAASNGAEVTGVSFDGIIGISVDVPPDVVYTSLIAYRSTESPPDEGGGDDDEPQPPLGG